MPENVLVIKNTLLHPYITNTNGSLVPDADTHIISKIIRNQTFMGRDEAEYNFDYKQVIPYVIIRNGTDYLLLKRTKKQTEKRLHDKYSLGIGGHINPGTSETDEHVIMKGLHRELNEEILLHDPGELNFIGIINDESNSVSRVHLGLLFVLEVMSSGYRVLETDKMTAQWISKDKLINFYPAMETWSRIACDFYILNKRCRESGSQGVK